MDLLQEICKDVSLKHTGTIFKACSRYTCKPTSTRHFTTPNRYAYSQGINDHSPTLISYSFRYPVVLQQQLSKMKAEIRHLQQMKRPNYYPILVELTEALGPCMVKSFVDDVHFTYACPTNLTPTKVPTHYQNHWASYVPKDTLQYLQS